MVDGTTFWFVPDSLLIGFLYSQLPDAELDIVEEAWFDETVGGES